MKKFNFLFALLFVVTPVFSQNIHTPAEILKIMTDSKISYEIDSLGKPVKCKDYSDRLNVNNKFRIVTKRDITVRKIQVNQKAQPYFDKAEKFFQAKNPDSAIVNYKLALQVDDSLYYAMTYIGQMYEMKKDYKEAIKWFKRAVHKNYIDYMAHWFMADDYIRTHDVKDAVNEIVLARILNRNNPRIKQSMTDIFLKDGRDTTDWYLNPQMKLKKNPKNNHIIIRTDSVWLFYAMAKALWTYEPGYKESMGIEQNVKYSTKEERECLANLLMANENKKLDFANYPPLRTLKMAVDKKDFGDFILYEVFLPYVPAAAYNLDKKTLMDIKDYILKVRNPKVKTSSL